MATNDPSPLSGTSLLELGLDEITAPDEGKDMWAEAGRALVDRVGASMRQQREANERACRDRESSRPLSERYDYQFEQAGSSSQEDRQQGL